MSVAGQKLTGGMCCDSPLHTFNICTFTTKLHTGDVVTIWEITISVVLCILYDFYIQISVVPFFTNDLSFCVFN